MRKIITTIILVVLLMLLVSCGSEEAKTNTVSVENQNITLSLNNIGDREGVYTGEMEGSLPNGIGTFVTKNTEGETWTYEGEWTNGQITGEGKQYFEDGCQSYEGGFIDNQFSGSGTLYEEGNLRYSGEFLEDLYEGEGTLYDNNGNELYKGDFKKGKPSEVEKVKASSVEVTYDELERNPDKYESTLIAVTGYVYQVLEPENDEDSETEYLIATNGYDDEIVDATYVREEGESRVLEGDTITVYGISDGLFTYETVDGESETVPSITIFVIE